ncbi:hypothetical protein [Brevibacillus invocatus]|uniref:hypothetical protein n=1 Tax=Brevibacillus invocatus TaxID=173959 RepID=UPI0030B8544E
MDMNAGIWLMNAYVINQEQRVFAVIDGVSSLSTGVQESEAARTSGARAAELVKRKLEAVDGKELLTACLVEANDALREEMLLAEVDLQKKEYLWGQLPLSFACRMSILITPRQVIA